MAFFDSLKKGTNEPNPLSNRLVTEDNLRVKIKQLLQKEVFHQIEPLEVVEILKDENESIDYGRIIGRYVYSEQDLSIGRLSEFRPIGANIIQMPLPGDIVLGFDFFGERYYLPQSLVRAKAGGSIVDPLAKLNTSDFNLSDMDGFQKSQDIRGDYFRDNQYYKIQPNEGDTFIQGRFGNYIQLGSNQYNDLDDSGDLREVREDFKDSPNIYLGAISSSIELTSNEEISFEDWYQEPSLTMLDKFSNELKDDVTTTKPHIIFDSHRVVINAKSNATLFSNNNFLVGSLLDGVYLQGEKNVDVKAITENIDITTLEKDIRIKAKKNIKALAEEESIEARAEKNIITRAKNNNEVIADDGKVKLHGGGSREPVALGNTLKSLLDDLSQSLISFGTGLTKKTLTAKGTKLAGDVSSIKGRLNTILSKKVETQ